MTWYSENKFEPSRKYWWEVVFLLQPDGNESIEVVRNNPYTKEHETQITELHDSTNNSLVHVLFEYAYEMESAKQSAKKRLKFWRNNNIKANKT